MKVAIVPSWYPTPEKPTTGIFVQAQAHALASAHEVVVVHPYVVGRREITSAGFMNPTVAAFDGVRIIRPRVALRPQMLMTASRFQALWAKAVIRGLRLVQAESGVPDLIHAHVGLPAGSAAVNAGEALGLPVVLTEHTAPFSALVQTPARERTVLEALVGADRVVAVGPSLANEIDGFVRAHQAHMNAEVAVVGNVIDDVRFRILPQAERSRPRLLSIGNLIEKKGHRFLLQALPLLSAAGIDCELTIVGMGPLRGGLESLAESLGIADRVNFVDRRLGDDLVRTYAAADIFVSPSLVETFGVVVAEALACGVPAVVTRSGGPEWFVGDDNGMVVEPRSDVALAAGISRLLERRASLKREAVRATVVARFGRAAFTTQMTGLYHQAVESRAKRNGAV